MAIFSTKLCFCPSSCIHIGEGGIQQLHEEKQIYEELQLSIAQQSCLGGVLLGLR